MARKRTANLGCAAFAAQLALAAALLASLIVTLAFAPQPAPAPTPRVVTVAARPQTVDGYKTWLYNHVAGPYQFLACERLFQRESGWDRFAHAPGTGAWGIPQLDLRWRDVPPDYRWNGYAQVRAGLRYLRGKHGGCLAAWRHEVQRGWY